jgi:hypothetical protein
MGLHHFVTWHWFKFNLRSLTHVTTTQFVVNQYHSLSPVIAEFPAGVCTYVVSVSFLGIVNLDSLTSLHLVDFKL